MRSDTSPRFTGLIAATAIFSVFCNVLMLTGPLFMLQVYDRVLASRSEETLIALFVLVAGLYALYGVFEYARGRVMARVGAQAQSQLSGPVFSEVLERAARKSTGDKGTVGDLDVVRSFASSPVFLALFDLPWTPIFIAAIFIFHPTLGWLAVLGGGLLVCVALVNQAVTARKNERAVGMNSGAQGFARTAFDRSEVVWAQGMQDATRTRFENLQDAALAQAMPASDWIGSFASFSKAFRLFLQSAMLAAGAWLVLQQELTAGAMIACSILLGRALAPVDMVIGQWAMVQRSRQAWSDIKSLLAGRERQSPSTELPVPEARLIAQNLTVVARTGDAPVLRQINFDLEPGDALGIIGRSGAGKSTLARVLTGLIVPTVGEVRLGGATLSQYGSRALGQHIGYLPQEVQLFPATVAENIAQMATEPDATRVVQAAKTACVHDVILALPDGYDTRIDEGSCLTSAPMGQFRSI